MTSFVLVPTSSTAASTVTYCVRGHTFRTVYAVELHATKRVWTLTTRYRDCVAFQTALDAWLPSLLGSKSAVEYYLLLLVQFQFPVEPLPCLALRLATRAELVSAFVHLAHAVLSALTMLGPQANEDTNALMHDLSSFLQVPTELIGVNHRPSMACSSETTSC
ncbi:hypothetical protein SPRG_13633 [Saprolegnia parasitica CBS 223.65]|uniref:PX domain-containing protein n=1 Tax=Saprolegnia parasitica (strain CBS 223.65) TaxID=695850 RepID=A0A067BRD9_SAPPC|nr:hypothetical protein SPRG_13633 [Saprolegnia parasitica CBS 223.65]KDO20818.1 hypothetical protein SPRG_13633 [Saprolegnia parasitica CBS 223.65]|eukprot:XP_012208476.1 hypothetical protein SPRG_13633 [Saprolegnia parasitica CBS 223.65]